MSESGKLAVFDLDGTLNQTHLYSLDCQKMALSDFGVTHITDQELLAAIGRPWSQHIRRLLPFLDEKGLAEFEERMIDYDEVLIPILARTYDGTEQSLRRLKEDGCVLAICTNASSRYVDLVMQSTGLHDYIDEIQPLCGYSNKTQSLGALLKKFDGYGAVMAGDTYFDLEAARNCGIPFVGCLYGYSAEGVADADRTVESAAELYDAITSLMGRGNA